MSTTYDLIAINERGVYAICYDEPGDEHVAEFKREAIAAGNRVERVTTQEACERHGAYLMRRPEFAKLFGSSPVSATLNERVEP